MSNPFAPGNQSDPMSQPLPGSSDPFDANAFMTQTYEGVGSTQVTPIPAGRYVALIGANDADVNATSFTNKKTNEQGLRLEVAFNLLDDSGALRAAIDGREPRINESFFLELDAKGRLDMGKGKNVRLNRLRAAVGQNTGAAWSPMMLRGAGPLQLDIVVEPDKQDPTIPRNRIKSIGQVTATGFGS